MTSVYLVDDHAMVREGLRAVLEHAALHVVGEADEPTQALADVLRLQPQLLMLDLNLGARSGFELLERVQQRKLATRTIVLTMSEQPRDVAQALRLGAQGYVLKGSPARDVLAAVQGDPALAAWSTPRPARRGLATCSAATHGRSSRTKTTVMAPSRATP